MELAEGRAEAGSQHPGSQEEKPGTFSVHTMVLWAIFTSIYWAKMSVFISL